MAKEKTGGRYSAGTLAGSDDKSDQESLVSLDSLLRPNPQPKPAESMHEVLLGIGRHLHNATSALETIYSRLLAVEQQTKRRGSRGFAGYLLAMCIGVAATLACLSYGEAAKQIIARKAPELGWSPEAKQMIAGWVEQLGWTKPPAGADSAVVQSSASVTPQAAPVVQTASAVVVPSAPIAPSIDPEQVHQIAVDLGALRQTAEQFAYGQDQMARVVDRLQGAVADILTKMPEPPPPPPIAAAVPPHKPKPVAPQLPPHP